MRDAPQLQATPQASWHQCCCVAYHSSLGLKHTRAMGIQRFKCTMTNNLTLFFLPLYHRRSKHTDRNIHADVSSKLFLGFDASQHTRQLISTLKTSHKHNNKDLSTLLACCLITAKQCYVAWLSSGTQGHCTEILMLCCSLACLWTGTRGHCTEILMLCCCVACGSGALLFLQQLSVTGFSCTVTLG